MKTEKVFHNDRYLKSLDATVLDVISKKDRIEIITDRTIFFAEGGGQPGDRGTMYLTEDETKHVDIYDTHDSGESVAHYTNSEHVPFNVGDKVSAGQTMFVLEAMKMENEIVAPVDGTVASINVKTGDTVDTDQVMGTLN